MIFISSMEPRPRIPLTLSPLDKTLEWTGNVLLVVIWGLTVYTFLQLPSTIPIHFNASGEADNFGDKKTILILPVLATLLYVGLTYLNKFPHVFNYMSEITQENAPKQYAITTRMLRFVKLAILLVFSLIILFTYLTTIGVTKGLGSCFLPLVSILFLVPVIIAISKSVKK